MKFFAKKNVFVGLMMCLVVGLSFMFVACGSYVPCAWVQFKFDEGHIVYNASDVYAYRGAHVYLYENEEPGTYELPVMEIRFSPRCMGSEAREVNGETVKTVLFDISEKWYAMYVTVYTGNSIYSSEKSIYLNGEKLVGEKSQHDGFVSYEFENFGLVQGNPNAHMNDEINLIEYKV